MANKTVTINEPTSADIQSITLIFDGAGNVSAVNVSTRITTSDPEVSHTTDVMSLAADWTPGQQAQFATMALRAAQLVSSGKGFPA
jgi:hypothetical protein